MPPLPPHKSPEENFETLKAFKDVPKSRAFLATLSPRERIELNAENADLNRGTFFYPNISPEEEPDEPKPTQEHVDKIYKSLFEMVKGAQESAKAKDEKLQLVIGEIRADRTALMTEAMLMHVCRRLGITDLGVETPPNGELMYPNRQVKYGLAEIKGQIKAMPEGRLLSEFGGITYTGQRRNIEFLTQLAMNSGMTSFSNDPNGLVDDIEKTSPRIRAVREEAMQKALDSRRDDCMTVGGKNRLGSLNKSTPGIHRLIINASHCFANSDETVPVPIFKDFTALTEDSDAARRIGLGERTGDSPLVSVFVEGNVLMARDALQMAKQADINIGEKLAPLQLFSPRGRQR